MALRVVCPIKSFFAAAEIDFVRATLKQVFQVFRAHLPHRLSFFFAYYIRHFAIFQ